MSSQSQKDFALVECGEPTKEPHIRWNGDYRVIELGVPGIAHDLPGQEKYIQNQVLNNRDTLILGERSSGCRDLLRWWCERLDKENRLWVMIDAGNWDRAFFKWSNHADVIKKSVENTASEGEKHPLEKFGQSVETTTNQVKGLSDWISEEYFGEPFTIIIKDLTALDSEKASQIATAFRSIRDNKLADELHVVIVSTSESSFLDLAEQSGYGPLTHRYRPATLKEAEIGELGRYYPEKPHSTNDVWSALELESGLDRFMDHTGGQPLLVRHLLHRLRERADSSREYRITNEEVDYVARDMRASPPHQATIWQDQLRSLLSENKTLIPHMEAYVMGKSIGPARFPPPSVTRPLFIAGWVKLNQLGRWCITSLFHAHLARPVLHELKEM